jgi:hypothetical protein
MAQRRFPLKNYFAKHTIRTLELTKNYSRFDKFTLSKPV